MKPHLDYSDIILIKLLRAYQRVKSMEHDVPLAITSTTRKTSKKRLYQELSLESLQSRRRFRKLSLLHEIISFSKTIVCQLFQ